jgi:hypothetical protein
MKSRKQIKAIKAKRYNSHIPYNVTDNNDQYDFTEPDIHDIDINPMSDDPLFHQDQNLYPSIQNYSDNDKLRLLNLYGNQK